MTSIRTTSVQRTPVPYLVAEWARRYQSGESLKQIAKAAGVYHMLIYRQLKAAGLILRPTGRPPGKYPVADWIRRYEAGESTVRISGDCGAAYSTVCKVLRQAGIPLRGAKPRWRTGQ